MVEKIRFFDYDAYMISSPELRVTVTTLGATALSVVYRGRELTLFHPEPDGYLRSAAYIGAIVGRYANRIEGARFTLNGREYRLTPNESGNQLHGGPNAFDRQVWTAEPAGESAVRFTYHSPDGENGFPGNLDAAVTYTVEGARLRLDFWGRADQDTIYAPTTHIYWNLNGGDVRKTVLQIAADRYLPIDEALIPTGAVAPVEGVFDFRTPRRVERGYDHCFVLSGAAPACTAALDGVRMELTTDYPALQLYTGGLLDPETDGYSPFEGFAVEPEYCPDSPNHPEYAQPVLRAGATFAKFAEYRFSQG